jgi:hypothetical protein
MASTGHEKTRRPDIPILKEANLSGRAGGFLGGSPPCQRFSIARLNLAASLSSPAF